MEEEEKESGPLALIIASVAAILVIGWLLIMKPGDVVRKAEAAETHSADSSDAAESNATRDVELNAEIVVAEQRDDDLYVQVQTSGAFGGTCEIALKAVEDKKSTTHEVALEPADRVSACESSFPLEDLEAGKYEVSVQITVKDGRTKNGLKSIKIE